MRAINLLAGFGRQIGSKLLIYTNAFVPPTAIIFQRWARGAPKTIVLRIVFSDFEELNL
jgi:hypothetical protein